MRKVQLTIKQEEVAPATTSDLVLMNNGRTLKEELSTNVLDKFSREVTVVSSMEKVADGVYDGAYESCVFKGRSLVNAIKNYSRSGYGSWSNNIALLENGWIRATASAHNNHFELKMDNLNIKPSTKYMYIIECRSNTFNGNGQTFQFGDTYKNYVDTPWTSAHTIHELPLGVYTFTLTTKSDFSELNNPIGDRSYICVGSGEIEFRYMIIEYQEGMENWNIPFFEGICDVKMPILCNVGKNLFNPTVPTPHHMVCNGATDGGLVGVIPVKPNTTYTLSVKKDTTKGRFVAKMSNRLLTSQDVHSFSQSSVYNYLRDNYANGRKFEYTIHNQKSLTFTTLDDCHYIYVNVDRSFGTPTANEILVFSEMTLEESPTQTTYEDYKTNILRTSEEIVLREVGGVCDTYNPLTGEYVKRIGEKVLCGETAEDWRDFRNTFIEKTETIDVYLINPEQKSNSNLLCDKMRTTSKGAYMNDEEGISCSGGSGLNVWVSISKNKLSTPNKEGFKQWLQSNPMTVQYELAEPITTIVEPLTIPFAYENGHIILESGSEEQSLLPELKYSVPASKNGVLSTTSQAILKHEQRLHKLENLLLREAILMDYRLALSFLDKM